MQNFKKVSLEKIATALHSPILFESRRKKLQKFLLLPKINIKTLWFPIIKNLLSQNLPAHQLICLVIDRTIWNRKNLIMISMIYDQKSIFVYFELLPKLGSSNFPEQTLLISQILPVFRNYKIILLADREFCFVQLANWLRQQKLLFCLRVKNKEFIEV